jgi:DNA (cytosine-5)-methyltransferase 1
MYTHVFASFITKTSNYLRMSNVDNTQNIISFCTGYGGLELGIRRAGVDVRTVCYCERETYVQAVLVKAIEEGRLDEAPIWSDLSTFPASEFRGKIRGITCGYPCQPFSSSGKRQGEKDPRHLWPRIREHARAIGVQWIFAENVEGHISLGLSTVISDLEEDGYKVAAGIFSAEEVGAPHRRKRVFILGNSTSKRSCGGSKDITRVQSEVLGQGSKDVAKSKSRQSGKQEARNRWQGISGGSQETRWPARPGEEQYEWESPRTIVTRLGGKPHGSPYRNKRLTLLGNGVVPQTAELAWKTLWKELNAQ